MKVLRGLRVPCSLEPPSLEADQRGFRFCCKGAQRDRSHAQAIVAAAIAPLPRRCAPLPPGAVLATIGEHGEDLPLAAGSEIPQALTQAKAAVKPGAFPALFSGEPEVRIDAAGGGFFSKAGGCAARGLCPLPFFEGFTPGIFNEQRWCGSMIPRYRVGTR